MKLPAHNEVRAVISREGRQGPLLVSDEATFKTSPAPALAALLNP